MDPGRHHHRGHERADAGEEGKYREAPTPEEHCAEHRHRAERQRRGIEALQHRSREVPCGRPRKAGPERDLRADRGKEDLRAEQARAAEAIQECGHGARRQFTRGPERCMTRSMIEAAQVKQRARELGFDLCGIARARRLPAERLDRWLERGWDAGLDYVRARREERLDPALLLPNAASVIVVACSYAPASGDPEPRPGELVVARYARGRDYHNVVLKPVRKLATWLRQQGAAVYAEVDAGAVMEKAWAQEAGLGWIGKNGCLIHERLGSWLLLGALVTDAILEPDAPHHDRCGDCALCIAACPTSAIPEPRYVDAGRCIAYHTIEHRDPIPAAIARRAGARLFGCDACQDVCPWNRRAPPASLVQLRSRTPSLPASEVLSLSVDEARRRFEGTPLLRAGRDGLVRTALALRAAPDDAVERFADDASPGVRDQARAILRAAER